MQGLYRRRTPSPFLLTRAVRLREWSPGSPHVRGAGFSNTENVCLWNPESAKKICLWNPKSWALESGLQFKKSGIPLTIGFRIQVPLTKTRIQYLGCVIHSVKSRIQDSLGLLYSVAVYRQTRRASIVIKNL